MSRDDGNSAFPVADENGVNYPHMGMTLRDYFAAKAMQGWIATFGEGTPDGENTAMLAYKIADVMLLERDK